ncbi:MAG: FAD-binding oxidoreductase [Candidatus Thermoplasmatota archaeon]|nr:FAD-binding oxidoreductase [Candidatus Thermoplasmatota archaeon]MBU1940798.1 FAD-binding oxidoreductase [Candidatus Thermoplasmatota archaeon]
MSNKYDAIVIGAGSVGNPTAYFLAQHGMKVLVLDELASSGQGENKAAIGGVRATHSDPAKIQICLHSLKIFSTWKDKTGTDIGWKQGGYCFPVYRHTEEDLLRSMLPLQKKFGLTIDWYESEKIKDIIPGINIQELRGGTYSPYDGQVSPLLVAESFTNEASKLGAEYHYRESVIELLIDVTKKTIIGVKTTKGTYHSDIVVNAAGAHATAICAMVGLDIPINPDSHEAGISAPIQPFLEPFVVDLRPGPDCKTANFYFGQNLEGQIIFCYTPLTIFPGEDRRSTSEFMPIIAQRLVSLIPRLKNLTIRRVWRGLYPMTPDGVAVVGKPSAVDGLYLGIGMCGQGFMMGPGVGYNIAHLITKGTPAIKQDVFNLLSPDRDFFSGKKEALK